jgi:hypothetical protein
VKVVVALGWVGAGVAVVPGSALATLWVSSSGTDTGYCSLANPCATISRAVSLAIPNDTIYVGAGRFTDHVTVPASISGLVLQAAGMKATTVSGGFDGSGSVFTIQAGATVTIADMSITGGYAPYGGGVNNAGALTMQRDEVAGNAATRSGGGVYSSGPGSFALSDSAIAANQAGRTGGGLAVMNATLDRDLIYANKVFAQAGVGGGLWIYNGSLSEDTITGNQVLDGAGNPAGSAGGAFVYSASFVSDTIVNNTASLAGNVSGNFRLQGTILAGDCTGSDIMDLGYNLDENGTCSRRGIHTIVGKEPMLGPLADNGGPTLTMAIPASSPAYDANPRCVGTDQRGVSLLQRGASTCDIGAYQVSAPTTYVANPPAALVTAYATGATGDASPVLSLSGPATGLGQPTGVVTNVNGDVFVANAASNSITEYAPEVTGNATPIATIAGASTKLNKPQDVALNRAGRLFVTNLAGSVTEYAPGARGNVAPVARISGANTRLYQPHGIVIDPGGDLRVTNANGTVTTYRAQASGNVAPISRLNNGVLKAPRGLNFDPAGRLLVADASARQVDTFASSATGHTQPLSVLIGAQPGLSAPTGLDLDQAGNLFVTDSAANSVIEYPPSSSGTAPPLANIAGTHTGLAAPGFLSELPPTPAPRLRVSTSKRQSRTRILGNGIALRLRASGSMAFRGQPVLISAVARMRGLSIATAKVTQLRPGRSTLRLLDTRRAASALRRHRRRVITVTINTRDGAGTQTDRVSITCTG